MLHLPEMTFHPYHVRPFSPSRLYMGVPTLLLSSMKNIFPSSIKFWHIPESTPPLLPPSYVSSPLFRTLTISTDRARTCPVIESDRAWQLHHLFFSVTFDFWAHTKNKLACVRSSAISDRSCSRLIFHQTRWTYRAIPWYRESDRIVKLFGLDSVQLIPAPRTQRAKRMALGLHY